MSHQDLVRILANALMIKELNQGSFTLQVVTFDAAERVDKFEALTIIEGIVDLQGRRLHMLEALLE